jgi:hypothetical protein
MVAKVCLACLGNPHRKPCLEGLVRLEVHWEGWSVIEIPALGKRCDEFGALSVCYQWRALELSRILQLIARG